MKHNVWFTFAILSLWWGTALAQVYESKDKSGVPVFSDQPSQGAKPVDLPPPNVVGPQQRPTAVPLPAQPSFSYAQLAILAPAQEDTVHTNTGAFDVQVSVDPVLRSGDVFVVTLDGNALPGRYSSANIGLTAQDYASAATSTHQHSLAVSVVDANGNVLISTGPVNFYVDRSTVRRRRAR